MNAQGGRSIPKYTCNRLLAAFSINKNKVCSVNQKILKLNVRLMSYSIKNGKDGDASEVYRDDDNHNSRDACARDATIVSALLGLLPQKPQVFAQ